MRSPIWRAALAVIPAFVLGTAAHAQGASPLLVSPQELRSRLSDRTLVLLYVGPKDGYDKEHIPGARYLELQDILVRDTTRRGFYLPDEADLRARLERFGIGDDSHIVVTPGADWGSPSTRAIWSLQAAGLGGRTQLLNGGTLAWKAAGLPLTSDVPSAATTGHLTVRADRSVVVDHLWIQAHENSPHVKLIDARSPVFFEGPGTPEHDMGGRHVPANPAGHIHGARNLPFDGLFDDSVHFFPIAELKKKFDAAGVAPGDTVAAYCHVGQQATAVLFAARLLGHPIRLYDGSMADWQSFKLPIEGGTPPGKTPDRQGNVRGTP